MDDNLKQFRTLDELIELMIKRNIIIDEKTKKRLYYDSHYSIINGYKKLFIARSRDSTGDDKYLDGTKFEEIYALYLLDRELRSLFLKELMRAETFLKNVICYVFYSQFGDEYSYLDISHYEHERTNLTYSVINKLQGTIDAKIREFNDSDEHSRKHNAISYYNEKYNFIPLWVLMRFLNFTDISKMFGALRNDTQSNIAKKIASVYSRKVNLPHSYVYTQIRAFVVCRNISAHDNIFYNHQYWGGRKAFYIYQSLKYYIPSECYTEFTLILKKILHDFRYETPFKIISANKILNIMGFPDNWDLN